MRLFTLSDSYETPLPRYPSIKATFRETLNKLIPRMVRLSNHARNQTLTIRPELAEGFNQRFLSLIISSVVILTLIVFAPRSVSAYESANSLSQKENSTAVEASVDIEVFVRSGCPHCKNAEKFLARLKQEKPALVIVVHDLAESPVQLQRLRQFAERQGETILRVPAFRIGNQLITGYSDESTTGQLIRAILNNRPSIQAEAGGNHCAPMQTSPCQPSRASSAETLSSYRLNLLGVEIALDEVGLPLFTLAMGLLDGFNPCSLWVLLLMISLLVPMQDRVRMFAVAGSFILVEGIAYFLFMSAWLNLFLLIGVSRVSEVIIAVFALLAGSVHLKDFRYLGHGFSLSIPKSAKPGIYAKMRQVLSAGNLTVAIVGAVTLAVLVQLVELMCTSGFPALYTRILTLEKLDKASYYSYLLLYNLAYMFDDFVILTIGIVTLSQTRLQEKEGKWLKLISGLVMVSLGIYLLLHRD